MAVITAINFLGIRQLARTNSAATWWKVGIPLLTIFVLAIVHFHGEQLHRRRRLHPLRREGHPRRGLHERHHLRAARLRAGRPARRREHEPEARHPARGDRLHRDRRGHLHRCCRSSSSPRCPPRRSGHLDAPPRSHSLDRPVRAARHAPQPRLAGHDPLSRRGHLPRRHRPDLHHRDLAGLLRPAAATATSRTVFERPTRRGVPWPGLIAAFVDRLHLLPAVPELAVAGRADHQRQRADVRRRAAVASASSATGCRTPSGRTGCPRRSWMSPLAFVVANLLILWSGWTPTGSSAWRSSSATSSSIAEPGVQAEPDHAAARSARGAVAARLPRSAWALSSTSATSAR